MPPTPSSPASPSSPLKFKNLGADGSEELAIRARAAAPRQKRGCLSGLFRCCCGGAESAPLIASVHSGAIAPLRGSWLVALKESGGKLSRRQDLPPEAFWTAHDLQRRASALGDDDAGLLFVALSSRWLSAEHADPHGVSLAVVAAAAKHYIGISGYYSVRPAAKTPLADAHERSGFVESEIDFAIFWDFASLMQPPPAAPRPPADAKKSEDSKNVEKEEVVEEEPARTTDEERLYQLGLRASSLWYRHATGACWLQTELPAGFEGGAFLDSGWAFAEAHTAALSNKRTLLLDLGKRSANAMRKAYGGIDWLAEDCLQEVAATRLPPRTPDNMRQLYGFSKAVTKSPKAFARPDDAALVLELYDASFQAFASSTTSLDYSGMEWGLGDLSVLLEAVPLLASLTSLDLSGNDWSSDAGCAAALGASLLAQPRSSLTTLNLSSTQLGAEGAVALAAGVAHAAASRRGGSLTSLDVSGNFIKCEGVKAIATALMDESSGGGGCGLTALISNTNEVRSAGAEALARLCVAVPSVATLGLFDNLLRDQGAMALAAALNEGSGHRLKALDVRSCGIGHKGGDALRVCRIDALALGVLIKG